MSAEIYRAGRLYVRAVPCHQCLLGPDRIVDGARARALVADTRADPGATFVCHRGQVSDEPVSVCAGWWDRFAGEDPALRLAMAAGVVDRGTGGPT